jgi:hypothetical protein
MQKVFEAMKELMAKSLRLCAIAFSCALFGAGVGFLQGEIVARGSDKLYQVAFAGGAAMAGAVIALFLGPALYYALHRRILFEEFCYVGALSSLVGCIAGWAGSSNPNGAGWATLFITPVAAVILALLFVRQADAPDADS